MEKISTTLEVFTIKKQIGEVEVQLPGGKKEKQPRYALYHFTTADRPVTYDGRQYIPLSMFDQSIWDIK